MIIIIHGDDIAASRKALQEEIEKQKGDEIIRLDGKKLSRSELIPAFESRSLFAEKKVIVIENFLANGITKEKQAHLAYLGKFVSTFSILLWEDRKIDKTAIKKYLTDAKEQAYVFPALLFRFLDSFGASTPSSLVMSFHTLTRTQDAELIFALLLRLVRQLILAKDMGSQAFGKLPGWQAEKYLKQASRWSVDELIVIYRQLLTIDVKIKTGQTPYNLTELLDLFFLSH